MGKYKVSAECLSLHAAIVVGESSEDAVEAYLAGEYEEDLGYSEPCDEKEVVFSVEEV